MNSDTASISIQSSLTQSLIGKKELKATRPTPAFAAALMTSTHSDDEAEPQTRRERCDSNVAMLSTYDENDDEFKSDSVAFHDHVAFEESDQDSDCQTDNKSETCSPLEAGSVNSSVLNLIACTVGAGTITMPYVIALTGIAFGSILCIIGAFLSHYSSSLLIKCNRQTGLRSYEDFAEVAFGSKKWRTVASLCLMISLLGFTTAYISLCKTLVPSIIAASVTEEEYAALPYWLQSNKTSQFIWATVFSFGILLPLASFKELSMLRFTSFFGVVCSVILMVSLIYEFETNEEVVPQPPHGQFQEAVYFNIDTVSIINAVPFIIFLFAYQPNIPQTYRELQHRSPQKMNKVIVRTNTIALCIFLIVGITGYLIFADRAESQIIDESRSKNILEADFGDSMIIQASRYFILVCVIAAAPLAFLPAKFAFETLVYKMKMTDAQNIKASVLLTLICYFAAVALPNVGSVIAIAGATINPFIGFIFPISFYLSLDKEPMSSPGKVKAQMLLFVVILVSVLGIYQLFAPTPSVSETN